MATLVLGALGGVVGSFFGAAAIGWAVGTTLAGVLFPPRQRTQERGRLEDLRITGSAYGTIIPRVFGQGRTAGNIIWMAKLEEVSTTSGGGKKGQPRVRNFEYFAYFAVMVCEGPVEEVRRIWANDLLIWDTNDPIDAALEGDDIEIYLGNYTDPPDPTIIAKEFSERGNEIIPAYRGRCYVVFNRLSLARFNSALPNVSFEIACTSTTETGLCAHWPFTNNDPVGDWRDNVGPNAGQFRFDGTFDEGRYLSITNELFEVTPNFNWETDPDNNLDGAYISFRHPPIAGEGPGVYIFGRGPSQEGPVGGCVGEFGEKTVIFWLRLEDIQSFEAETEPYFMFKHRGMWEWRIDFTYQIGLPVRFPYITFTTSQNYPIVKAPSFGITAGAHPSNRKFTRFAFTMKEGEIHLYENNVLIDGNPGPQSTPTIPNATNTMAHLNSLPLYSDTAVDGELYFEEIHDWLLDDVRIYNRALTKSQLDRLYNNMARINPDRVF